jgi:hypothetical protein
MQLSVGETAFTKTKYSALDGQTTVGYVTPDSSFQILSTKASVKLQGEFSIMSERELEDFARLVSDAVTEHRRMLKAAVSKLSNPSPMEH